VCRLTSDFERPGLPALGLTTDTSVLTAYANDYAFEGVFARQVQALGKRGDVLFGISTSGSSRNVVAAVATPAAANPMSTDAGMASSRVDTAPWLRDPGAVATPDGQGRRPRRRPPGPPAAGGRALP